jgi:hypothetical protein
MPRKPTKQDDAEQSKRFIETAEQVEADEERTLERAFKNITQPSRPSPAPKVSRESRSKGE